MANIFVIACTDCEKQIKVSEEVFGKKIRCKECGAVILVKESKAKPVPSAPPPKPKATKKAAAQNEEDDEGSNPYSLAKDLDEEARCPHCVKKLESPDQIICLHCGYNLQTRTRAKLVAVYETTQEEKFKWLLPGILCVVGIVFLVTMSIIIMLKTPGWMKGSFLHDTENGKDQMLIKPGCFMLANGGFVLYICYHLARFAYKRLVVNSKPPENLIEKDDDIEAEDD